MSSKYSGSHEMLSSHGELPRYNSKNSLNNDKVVEPKRRKEGNGGVLSNEKIECLSKMDGFSHNKMVYYRFAKLKGEKGSPKIETRKKKKKKYLPSMSSQSTKRSMQNEMRRMGNDQLFPTLPLLEGMVSILEKKRSMHRAMKEQRSQELSLVNEEENLNFTEQMSSLMNEIKEEDELKRGMREKARDDMEKMASQSLANFETQPYNNSSLQPDSIPPESINHEMLPYEEIKIIHNCLGPVKAVRFINQIVRWKYERRGKRKSPERSSPRKRRRILKKRARCYEVKFSTKKNMFGGLPFNQYNSYVRKDDKMQKLILRDQLLIIIDKISSLKNNVSDKGLIKLINSKIGYEVIKDLNMQMEEMIGLMEYLINKLIEDLLEIFDQIGMEESPLKKFEVIGIEEMNENKNLESNCSVCSEIIDYFKEGAECFFVLCRQQKMRVFRDKVMLKLLQSIMRVRYGVGKLLELFRMYWFDIEEIKKNEKEDNEKKDKKKKGREESEPKKKKKSKKSSKELIKELYKNKLKNFGGKWATRESKVDLKKETSGSIFNFNRSDGNNAIFKLDKKQIESNKKIIKLLDDEFLQFDKLDEVVDKIGGLEPKERIHIINRLLNDIPSLKTKKMRKDRYSKSSVNLRANRFRARRFKKTGESKDKALNGRKGQRSMKKIKGKTEKKYEMRFNIGGNLPVIR